MPKHINSPDAPEKDPAVQGVQMEPPASGHKEGQKIRLREAVRALCREREPYFPSHFKEKGPQFERTLSFCSLLSRKL